MLVNLPPLIFYGARKAHFCFSDENLISKGDLFFAKPLNSIYFSGAFLYLWCFSQLFTEFIHKFVLSNITGSWNLVKKEPKMPDDYRVKKQ